MLSFHSLHLEDGFTLNPKKSDLSPHPTLTSSLLRLSTSDGMTNSSVGGASAKEAELENICKSLQRQVCNVP